MNFDLASFVIGLATMGFSMMLLETIIIDIQAKERKKRK